MNTKVIRVKNSICFSIATLLMIALIGCQDQTTTAQKTEPQNKDTGAAAKPVEKAMVANMGFPVLCLDKTQLGILFGDGTGPNGVQKLVLKFNFKENLGPSLTVYKAKPNGTFIGGFVGTLNRQAIVLNYSGEFLLGNLELSRKKYDDLLKLPEAANATHLIFAATVNDEVPPPPPNVTDIRSITYKLSWGNCDQPLDKNKLLAGTDVLNPCPPNQPGQ